MKNNEILKEEYLGLLHNKMKDIKQKEIELKEENFIDESNMEKIKLNVIDIFVKMFDVSYNKAHGDYDELYSVYMNFFQKIPASWKDKAEKDKKFNMTKEYIIEKIKLDTMEEVKAIFQGCYNKRL